MNNVDVYDMTVSTDKNKKCTHAYALPTFKEHLILSERNVTVEYSSDFLRLK